MDASWSETHTAFDAATSRWKPGLVEKTRLTLRAGCSTRSPSAPLHLSFSNGERFKRIESENAGVASNLETNLEREPPEIPFQKLSTKLSYGTAPPPCRFADRSSAPRISITRRHQATTCQFSNRRPSPSKFYRFYRPAFKLSRINAEEALRAIHLTRFIYLSSYLSIYLSASSFG